MIIISDLVNEARNSLSSYCINDCKAMCCRKGFLLINTKEEADIVTQGKTQIFIKDSTISIIESKFMLNLEIHGPCPSLNNENLCTIHTNINRPRLCRDFPIFIVKNFIVLAQTCPAMNEDIIKPYIEKFKENGFTII